MTTIKIYDTAVEKSTIEIGNEGAVDSDELQMTIDNPNCKDYLFFYLSKDDARELIVYLKKQFSINP